MAMEQISPGTRKTLTGYMVPSFLKRHTRTMMKKETEKMKSKTVAFGFWKALDFERNSDRLYGTF
jgi:hypothetical protein